MSTTTFQATTTIQCPAAAAWAVLADYDHDPRWRRGVATMQPSTSGPAIVGTTTAEVLRLGGRTYRNGGEVTAVEPGSHLAWRTTSGADANGGRTVRSVAPDRCEVTLDLEVRFHGVQRLLRPFLVPMLRRGLTDDLRRLAALLEAQPSVVDAPVPTPR